MQYQCFMDLEEMCESVTVCTEPEGGTEIEIGDQPLFIALCDVMSLDLQETLVQLLNAEKPEEVASRMSFLLADEEFLEQFRLLKEDESNISGLRELFDWLHYLKAWFVGIQENEVLRNGELFRSYAEIILKTQLPALHLLENDPASTRLYLNPLNPDYRRVTDAFLCDMEAGSGLSLFLAEDFREYLVMSLYYLIRSGCTVTTCQNCGRQFVAYNRSDTLYCDRAAPQDAGKTCREYGTYFTRLEKIRHDDATHLYKQIYNRMGNRYRRTKTAESPAGNSRFQAELQQFREDSKAWKHRIQQGDAREKEYIEWLSSKKGEMGDGEHSGEEK